MRLRWTFLLAGLLSLPAAVIGQNAAATKVTVLFSPAMHTALETTYGSSEGAVLEQMIRQRVGAALRRGCDGNVQVEITLLDARPTHPTDRQIGDNAALDRLRTRYLGGAAFSARILDPDGRELKSLHYDWYGQDYRHGSLAAEPWGDVRLASEGLGSQLARECRALAQPRPMAP